MFRPLLLLPLEMGQGNFHWRPIYPHVKGQILAELLQSVYRAHS